MPSRPSLFIGILIILALSAWGMLLLRNQSKSTFMPQTDISSGETKTALFAGGCFWCVEADFEKLTGIISVVSGYAGGNADNPNYGNYAAGGHREVVEVTYDAAKTAYRDLVEHNIRYSDPTDAAGSFYDRGVQYAPAIYYETDEEKKVAEEVIAEINAEGIYENPITIVVLPRPKFWPAEEYHQDYAQKNPLRYSYYRNGSGRDAFIKKHMSKTIQTPKDSSGNISFEQYQKPSDETLKQILSPLQYTVMQKAGTEPPFENEYDINISDGIYVDRISGEPLFSSRDKYDSGTGWPSFVKPIEGGAVVLREDKGLFSTRIEVRSRYADSHLGHVFDDGPADRGGKRYCMNSAALLFVPKALMSGKGYGKYLPLFE